MPFMMNTDYWPLVIQFLYGYPTPEEFKAYHEHLASILNMGTRFGVLADFSRSKTPGVKGRMDDVKFLKDHVSLMKAHGIGAAMVAPSPFIRITLNGIFSLAPLPVPSKFFDDVMEAQAWIRSLIEAEGLSIPEGAAEWIAGTNVELEKQGFEKFG